MNLKLSIFINAGTVPLEIAIRHGFFQAAGLDVEIEGTRSSIEQMVGIIDGRYDIAATAIDNVIAYNCGQGAAKTKAKSDLKVFLGSASYRLPLVVGPSIASFEGLRGKTIAVDALNTGFAFLLREMLEINGLNSLDYVFEAVGAPKERWQSVKDGKAAGALLNAHFEAIAHAQNCKTLTSSPDPWDNYEGNTFCAGPEFLADGPVEAFTTAVLEGVEFTKDPANLEVVAVALDQHLGGLDPDRARLTAMSLQGPDSILKDGLPVSRSGIENVLRLREKYTQVELGLSPEVVCDPRANLRN
ncbi:MAG: ABC transporter substrate-binding protein [Rhizobiaceae bacterium]